MDKMDWMTCGIELVGVIILAIWIVVPIREFKRILQHLKEKDSR